MRALAHVDPLSTSGAFTTESALPLSDTIPVMGTYPLQIVVLYLSLVQYVIQKPLPLFLITQGYQKTLHPLLGTQEH